MKLAIRLTVLTALFASIGTTWATDVTLRLVDQNGNLIPASRIEVVTGGIVPQNGVITLPVAMAGAFVLARIASF